MFVNFLSLHGEFSVLCTVKIRNPNNFTFWKSLFHKVLKKKKKKTKKKFQSARNWREVGGFLWGENG